MHGFKARIWNQQKYICVCTLIIWYSSLPVFIPFLSATVILFIFLSYINETIYRIALLRLALSSATIFGLIGVLRSSIVRIFTVIFYHSLFFRNAPLVILFGYFVLSYYIELFLLISVFLWQSACYISDLFDVFTHWPNVVVGRLSINLPCPHDTSSQILAGIAQFAPSIHPGILSAGIENGCHWP